MCDKAPEFLRACKELNIAAFEGTPGRPTSHGKIERANRTTLEWTRAALEQSGLPLEWAGMAARHGLFIRRVNVANEDGVPIYRQKFPDLPMPSLWPFGGAVDFKPSNLQADGPKAGARGRPGILVGYHTNPGGSWSGDYLCADLRNFETNSGKKPNSSFSHKECDLEGLFQTSVSTLRRKGALEDGKTGSSSQRKIS